MPDLKQCAIDSRAHLYSNQTGALLFNHTAVQTALGSVYDSIYSAPWYVASSYCYDDSCKHFLFTQEGQL